MAAIGQAPTKFVLVSPNDREQMLLLHVDEGGIHQSPHIDLGAQGIGYPGLTHPGAFARGSHDGGLAHACREPHGLRRPTCRSGSPCRGSQSSDVQGTARSRGLSRGTHRRRGPDSGGTPSRCSSAQSPVSIRSVAVGPSMAATRLPPCPIRNRSSPHRRLLSTIPGLRKSAPTSRPFDRISRPLLPRRPLSRGAFPKDAGVALVSASFAEDLGRREDMYAAYERARAIAPNDPDVIAFGASIKADYARDIDGALADLYRVAGTDPSFALLNQIGLLEAGRGAPVEAEAAYRRAIAMEPQNPITYVNLALFLLDQSRVEEAGIAHRQGIGPRSADRLLGARAIPIAERQDGYGRRGDVGRIRRQPCSFQRSVDPGRCLLPERGLRAGPTDPRQRRPA